MAVAGGDDRGHAAQARGLERAARLVPEVPRPRTPPRDPEKALEADDVRLRLPLFTYEGLVADWTGMGLTDDILAKVLHENARMFFDSTRFSRTLD